MEKLDQGHVVYSIAGRDKGLVYLVWATDADFVYLVDGRKRKPESPKRKRMKHVKSLGVLEIKDLEHILAGRQDGSAASRIRRKLIAFRMLQSQEYEEL